MADGKPSSDRAGSRCARFAEFWSVYPRKVAKKAAKDRWRAKRLDRMADQLIADVRERAARDRRWVGGYIPNPTTYLNQERWEDEIEEERNPQTERDDAWLRGAI